MDLIIREATPSDYENLSNLFDEIDKLHYDHLPEWFQDVEGPARDKAFVFDLLNDQAVAVFVAENNETLLGLIQAVIKTTPPMAILKPRRYAVVDTLVVKKGFQQQGIGQKLMDMVHQWATSKGASSVELNVYAFNQKATDFYRKLGYETISRKMSKSL